MTPPGSRRRWPIAVVGALVVVVTAFVSVTVTTITGLELCSGDGGSSYSADASTAGRFCDSGWSGPYFLVLWLGPVLATAALTVLAAVRRTWSWLGWAAGGSVLVIVVMAGVAGSLPDECSPDQVAAGEDCESY